MNRLLICGLFGLVLFPNLGQATDGVYYNNGIITFPPQIDATNFVNDGTFDFSANPTVIPFDTSNTQNFTNNGTMFSTVGFQFDNAPSTGPRKMAANFVNRLQGVITAADGVGFATLNNGNFTIDELIIPSYLLVSATNLVNQGVLTAGGGGLMRLSGGNVNLTRSGLQIQPIVPQGSINEVATNYFLPDVAIYDNYWGQTNQTMNSSTIIRGGGSLIVSPASDVRAQFGGGRATVVLFNPVGDFYTNTLGTTNFSVTNMTGTVTITNLPTTNIVQAVFVGLPPGNDVAWGVRFFDSSSFQNPLKTVSVGVAMISTNVVTAGLEQTAIYLVDTLASETNRTFYTNFLTLTTLRPQNYLLERLQPFEFAAGFPGNAGFAPDLLYKGDFASAFVTNDYGAYSAFIDNIASRPPNIPAGTVTNLPGRVEVFADNLDMSRARFRADGLLNITAKHLVSSSNAVVDCENLSYNLGSTNGNLKIQNLALESVARLKGNNFVWSGVWTNFQNQVIENWDLSDTNAGPVQANITNVVEFRIYSMVYNAGQLLTQIPVVVDALTTHSTNVVVNDRMTVVQTFLIDGQSFTLNGSITFSNKFFTDTLGNTVTVSLDSWVSTNAPILQFFTNNGNLNIPSAAHFGDDRLLPYATFVNRGVINANGQTINSDYSELAGENNTAAAFTLITRSAKVENGTVASGGDALFYADVLKFGQARVQTDSRLDLSVTNSLFDSGDGAGNYFSCNDGFRLLIKPQAGDLLGTFVETIAPSFAEVDHVWAGADRGPNAAGFLNNTALGTLLLTPGALEAQFPPLFVFAGTGGNNGLYVDVLDLSQLLDYQNELQINPNLVIYYAAAKLGFTPPPTNGVDQLPEEYLNGQFNGRLQWVQDFAGPNSSVDVVINGQTAKVNRALRNSKIIDSDGDGVPNYYDFNPFDSALLLSGSLVQTNQAPATAFRVSWTAVPGVAYQLEFTTNTQLTGWQPLMGYTNNAPTNITVTIWDTNVPTVGIQRFYRVGHGP